MNQVKDFRIGAIRDVLWDYKIDPLEAERMLLGDIDRVGGMYRNELLIKLLNMYSWHKVRQIIPAHLLEGVLTEDVIKGLFPPSLRDKYRYVRSLL